MKATTLKKKYPEIWDNVYSDMITDLCSCMPQADVQMYNDGYEDCRITRIAHNAAFCATYEVDKKLKELRYKR